MDPLKGYRGEVRSLLEEAGVRIGDLVEVTTPTRSMRGVLMPRYEHADDEHLVLKLENGYNAGIAIRRVISMRLLERGKPPTFVPPPKPSPKPGLPKVVILSTGGTIASRIDYRTGSVVGSLSAEDLVALIPELAEEARIECKILMNKYSEDLEPKDWSAIARAVAEEVRKGCEGLVITHGTDTLGYTAAALSFALQGLPIPVILTGAQRSSDRPSSDAATNLLGAVKMASQLDLAGVFVAMHYGLGDDAIALHLGTRVRKNHTSRRDAFQSIGVPLVGLLKDGAFQQRLEGIPKRGSASDLKFRPSFDERVALIKFHPGFHPAIIERLVEEGLRGLVLEGTGLGHIGKRHHSILAEAIKKGVLVGMTSQCLWGRVRMTVYDTGRDLLRLGVIPLEDMLPETALVKMMWVLANASTEEEAKQLLTTNLAGELSHRSLLEV